MRTPFVMAHHAYDIVQTQCGLPLHRRGVGARTLPPRVPAPSSPLLAQSTYSQTLARTRTSTQDTAYSSPIHRPFITLPLLPSTSRPRRSHTRNRSHAAHSNHPTPYHISYFHTRPLPRRLSLRHPSLPRRCFTTLRPLACPHVMMIMHGLRSTHTHTGHPRLLPLAQALCAPFPSGLFSSLVFSQHTFLSYVFLCRRSFCSSAKPRYIPVADQLYDSHILDLPSYAFLRADSFGLLLLKRFSDPAMWLPVRYRLTTSCDWPTNAYGVHALVRTLNEESLLHRP